MSAGPDEERANLDDVRAAIEARDGPGLLALLEQARQRLTPPFVLEPPAAEWLDDIEDPPEDLTGVMLDLLYFHPFLDPEPTDDERQERATDLTLRRGTAATAFRLALDVAVRADADAEADGILRHVRTRGFDTPAELRQTETLVSALLDRTPTRAATVRALGRFKSRPDLAPVYAYVEPQLTDEERAEIDEW